MQTCECGCGKSTPLATSTNRKRGLIKGEPIRFIHGHNMRAKRRKGPDYLEVDCGYETPCWVWQHGTQKGYGTVSIGPQTSALAHRVYFEERYGYLPNTLHHRCENPPCVNPDHLEPARRADNVRIGRHVKLTVHDVREIKRSSDIGTRLAERYGVHKTTIYNIRAGRIWADVN